MFVYVSIKSSKARKKSEYFTGSTENTGIFGFGYVMAGVWICFCLNNSWSRWFCSSCILWTSTMLLTFLWLTSRCRASNPPSMVSPWLVEVGSVQPFHSGASTFSEVLASLFPCDWRCKTPTVLSRLTWLIWAGIEVCKRLCTLWCQWKGFLTLRNHHRIFIHWHGAKRSCPALTL